MSRQQSLYLALRAAGAGMMTAAAKAEIPVGEARLIENAIVRGEVTLAAEQPTTNQEENDMGRKARAKAEEVEEVTQPDFELAANILRSAIKSADEASAKARGDLSAAWARIEKDAHVNKKAAKLVHWMRTASDELKDDFLRSLYGLMLELKLGISPDLVDRMGDDAAPSMPVAGAKAVGTADLATLQ